MTKEIIEACNNSSRQRIIQTLLKRGECTTSEIGRILSDIPRASLYRHVKVLLDAGMIRVTKENQGRGSVEKTFALAKTEGSAAEGSPEDQIRMVQTVLNGISADFSTYFSKPNPDPVKDMLSVGMCSLMLSDAELMEFFTEYGKLVERLMGNEKTEERKVRKIAFFSIPDNG